MALLFTAARGDAASEQRRDFVPSVRVAAVRASDGIVLVTLPATTSAFAVANIFARASGYIDKRKVDIGDRVKEGQLLAQITAPELDHQIAQAQATLAQLKAALQQAQANPDLAQVTWDRDKPLVKQGWVTPQQGTIDVQTLKAQEAAVGVAQANVTAQQAQLQVLNQQKAYQTRRRAVRRRHHPAQHRCRQPGAGRRDQRHVHVHHHAEQRHPHPGLRAAGPGVRIGPGVEAVVRVPEIPDRTFPGKVTRIADALQPGTRTLLTEIDIPNPDGALTPGIYCTVELHIPRKTPALLVPADAIIFNADGLQVAVVENGVARIRKISVARDLGKEVEVRDGVKQGDQVILNPSVDLVEGSKVSVRPLRAAMADG